MKLNVGSTDKLVRYGLAIVFFLVAFFWVSGFWTWVFVALGLIMGITASLNFCPIWAMLGISTRRKA